MSWLSKLTGININVLHPKNSTDQAAQTALVGTGTALLAALQSGQATPTSAFVTAEGNIVAELKPVLMDAAEQAISTLLVEHGAAPDTAGANALIEAALTRAGL